MWVPGTRLSDQGGAILLNDDTLQPATPGTPAAGSQAVAGMPSRAPPMMTQRPPDVGVGVTTSEIDGLAYLKHRSWQNEPNFIQ
jgi:hypothetical protein